MPIIAAPLEALAVSGFILAGIPVYYLTQGNGNQPRVSGKRLMSRPRHPIHAHSISLAVKAELTNIWTTSRW